MCFSLFGVLIVRDFFFWFDADEYMSLPASQYSVLDAERIERIDDCTFRCHVYRFKFFAFEVCPVLVVKVELQPNGCCIKLLSCKVWINLWNVKCSVYFLFVLIVMFLFLTCLNDGVQLEGSPIVVAQNDKFDGENLNYA